MEQKSRCKLCGYTADYEDEMRDHLENGPHVYSDLYEYCTEVV